MPTRAVTAAKAPKAAKTAARSAEKNGKWYPPLPIWTAADLMTPNPASIRGKAAVAEAAGFLDKRGSPPRRSSTRPAGRSESSAAPTSSTTPAAGVPDLVGRLLPGCVAGVVRDAAAAGSERFADEAGSAPVGSIMTPLVYSVQLKATAGEIVDAMVGCKVHRLFVTDAGGVVVGVISAMNILAKLRG